MQPTTPRSRPATQRPAVPPQRGEPAVEREYAPQHAARDARGRFLPRPPAHALREPAPTEPDQLCTDTASTEPGQWDDLVGSDESTAPAKRPFNYAGLRWKPEEDRIDGAWIGYRLAAELYHRTTR